MKKQILSLLFGMMLILGCGCTKFEPATVDLSVTPIFYSDKCLMDCKGTVTNNGGCKYFNEMGFLYSLSPDPTYKGEEVITKAVIKDVETVTFDLNFTEALTDTIYYVRAYVCTNAGTGYSETKMVPTYLPEDDENE